MSLEFSNKIDINSLGSNPCAGEVKFQNNKIRSVQIERPFRLEWTDIPDLVVLAGKNGSGKSCLLEFLNEKFRLHQQTNGSRQPLESIYRADQNSLHKYSHEYEQALAQDFVDHLKRSKIYRSSFLNDVKEYIRSRDDNFFSMYYHRHLCKKIALEILKINSDPNSSSWRSDATMAIDRFADQIKSDSSRPEIDLETSQLFNRPMNYLLSLIDQFNHRVLNHLASSQQSGDNESGQLESERAKLVLLFNNINSKLIKYNMPYKFDWVEHNDCQTELRFINTQYLVNQIVYAHFSTRRQNYHSFKSLINQFTVRDESSLAMDSSPLVYYGEFSSGEKMIFDLIAWTSLIEENMINVGLIILDEPDAHLNSANLETLIHLLKGLFLNSALNAKSIQVIITTNRIELVRLMRKHVSTDFSRIGLDLKLKKKRITNGGDQEIERVDERFVQPIKAESRKVFAGDIYGAKFSTYTFNKQGVFTEIPPQKQPNYIDARSFDFDEKSFANLSSKIDDLADRLQNENSLYTNEMNDIKNMVDQMHLTTSNDSNKKRKKLVVYA